MTDGAALVIRRPGPLALIQDLGREGHAALGVPPSGAADRPAMALANRLAGNPEPDAVLEITAGGFVAEFTAGRFFALTGAPAEAWLGRRAIGVNGSYYAAAGTVLRLGALQGPGLRTYLAVAGGIVAPDVLGSRSTDLMSELGPAPLRVGDRIPVGRPSRDHPGVSLAPCAPIPAAPVLDVMPGPRTDWFAPDALALLTRHGYTVTSELNRIGIRLAGPVLPRNRTGELPPEGMVTGSLQVPPTGQPILFLADHPPTGGYPVVAVATTASLATAAQLAPGTVVRFRVLASTGWQRTLR